MRNKLFLWLGVLILVAGLVAFAGSAFAQGATPTPNTPAAQSNENLPVRTISVTGSGKAFLTPDIAYVNIGVHSEGADAAETVAANSEDVQQVIEALRTFGINARDIKTTNFSIYPQQRWDNQGQPTGEITYVVDNTVMVTVRDLDQIGELLDAAVSSGSNSINGIQFDVEDKADALAAARQAAVSEARSIAEELAQAAGVQVGAIQNISVSSGQPVPIMYDMSAAREAAVGGAVPVQTGEMTVTVEVNVVFQIQ